MKNVTVTGGNEHESGIAAWWHSLGNFEKAGVVTFAALILSLFFNFFTIWLHNRIDENERQGAEKNAKSQLSVAQFEAQTALLKAQAAESMRKAKNSSSTPPSETMHAASFACDTVDVMMRNFAMHSNNPQAIPQGKILGFGSGCAWTKFDYKVTHLEGENYLIAFASPQDDHYFDKCGRIAPNDDMSGSCMAMINNHAGVKFRVIVKNGGYLKIGGAQ